MPLSSLRSGSVRNVAANVVGMVVRAADRTGTPLAELLEGLPHSEADLRRRWARLPWDDFTILIDRLTDRLGYDRLAAICAHIPDLAPDDRPLLSIFVSPVMLHRFVNDLLGPLMYPMLEAGHVELDDGTMWVSTRLRPGFRECHTFFRLCEPSHASTPCFLGLPPSEVRAVTTPRSGDYWIRPRRGDRAPRRVASGVDELAIEALHDEKARLLEAYRELWRARPSGMDERLDAAEQMWGLTPRQRQVLAGLARGLANKELASELGCSAKTIEAHVTELLFRTRQESRLALVATFWRETDRR